MKSSVIAFFMVMVAAVLWGSIGFAQSFMSAAVPVYWIASGRFFVASLFFFLLLILHKNGFDFKNFSSHIWFLLLLAALSITINNFCFFYGVRETGIAIGSVATIGSAPIWAGLLAIFVNRKIPSKSWWLGVCCAAVGVTWMAISQAHSWFIDLVGLGSCLIAGLCYACFSQLSAQLVKQISSQSAMAFSFMLAFLIATLASCLLSPLPNSLSLIDYTVVLYLGVFTTGVAFLLYTRALSRINFNTAVALSLLDPVTAFLLAVFVVHEPIQLNAVCGLLFILFGLRLVMKNELTSSPKEN